MKIKKYIWMLTSAVLLATSCDDGNMGAIFEPTEQEKGYSFVNGTISGSYLPDYTDSTLVVTIARNFSEGAFELPLTLVGEAESLFTIPAVASFADGNTSANITIGIKGMEVGESYSFALAIDSANVGGLGIAKVEIELAVDYVWESAGVVLFESAWEDASGEVPIEKAQYTGPNGELLYRLNSPYNIIAPAYCSAPGMHLQFYLDKDYNALKLPTGIQVVEDAPWSIYWALPTEPYGSYCGFKNESNKYTISVVWCEDRSPYNFSDEVFTWTTGYPGEIQEEEAPIDWNALEYKLIEGEVSEFQSAAFSLNWEQTIGKAVDLEEDNDTSIYKNLYCLQNLYTDNFGLTFYYDGTDVNIIPEQKTGIQFAGKDLYMSGSNIPSSVTTAPNGATVYTFNLVFHYEDGTIFGAFEEVFYYSATPLVFTIDDFCGNFILTGESQFDQPAAEMPLVITKKDSVLSISGVNYAKEILATFDSETSTMSIAPQKLDSLTSQGKRYDMALYTTTLEGDVSTTEPIILSMRLDGALKLAKESDADGYLIRSEVLGGWVDGYYGLKLTPYIPAAPVPAKTPTLKKVNTVLSQHQIVNESKKLSTKNFKEQGKMTGKRAQSRVL